MTPSWERDFRHRMMAFAADHPLTEGEVPVSIKVRVSSGCFHREHSPLAYRRIDKHLSTLRRDQQLLAFEEHESGPEILAYVTLGAATVSLASSIINLVVAVLRARSDGVKAGDRPSDPLELIVRTVRNGDEYVEEVVLKIGPREAVDSAEIEKRTAAALEKLVGKRRREGS